MRTHIKVVAIINIIFGAIGVLAGLSVFVGGTFGSMMSGSLVGAVAGTVTSALIGVIIACISGISVVAGFGLLNGKQWARYVVIVLSVLYLFSFPWKTIFGVYSLWALLSAEGKREFTTVSV